MFHLIFPVPQLTLQLWSVRPAVSESSHLRFGTSYENSIKIQEAQYFILFPKIRNCEVCLPTKITREDSLWSTLELLCRCPATRFDLKERVWVFQEIKIPIQWWSPDKRESASSCAWFHIFVIVYFLVCNSSKIHLSFCSFDKPCKEHGCIRPINKKKKRETDFLWDWEHCSPDSHKVQTQAHPRHAFRNRPEIVTLFTGQLIFAQHNWLSWNQTVILESNSWLCYFLQWCNWGQETVAWAWHTLTSFVGLSMALLRY